MSEATYTLRVHQLSLSFGSQWDDCRRVIVLIEARLNALDREKTRLSIDLKRERVDHAPIIVYDN